MSGTGHYNLGNVWGKIIKAEEGSSEGKGTKYLDLQIDCTNAALGNGRAFGRMWGKEKTAILQEHLKTHKDDMIRLKGFYEQYVDRHGKRGSSYTFYDFMQPSADDLPRAAFILVGDLAEKKLVDGEPFLTLNVIRPQKDVERSLQYEITLFDVMAFYEVIEGDLIEVRGLIRRHEAEDLYGGQSDGPIRPYAMTVKKRMRKRPADDDFVDGCDE